MGKAIFIDRDGTIGGNEQVVYPEAFTPFNYVLECMAKLKDSGFLLCSFTNQPGIAKGEATREEFENELASFGFDHIYLCPHQPDEGCQCRKPATGMLRQAAHEHDLQLHDCVVIGDRWTDMLAAHEAGCIKILVRTGAGEESLRIYENGEYEGAYADVSPEFVAADFQEAVNWIIER
ncbi:histidinol-phosphate phosphatase family protein [Sporosarcina luteola]|nr:histidinol-phosphate phosphatase family protein [Sporosarcina luteola]